MLSSLGFLAALAASANAHTIFQRLYVNGVDQGYLNGIRYPTYDGPITDVTDPSVICNGGPNPLVTPYSQTIINVPAGAQVGAQWDHVLQPNGWSSSDPADPIDPSHLGPLIAYMAKVPDAHVTDVTGLGWFKIFQDGYDGTTWGVQRLIKAHGNQTFTIPACLEPGNYFLRAEIIALHAASSYPGAQLYMECAQINVVGGGTATPPTVSFPGAYSGTDPGILIDIYYPPVTSYTVPGPTVYTCGGASAPTSTSSVAKPTTSTSTKPITTTTAKPSTTSTTSAKPTTTSSSGGVSPIYGQCGGIGWTGPTTCAAGSTCVANGAYYSQCVPS